MPNYLEYQKSIAQEFKAYENRVRNLIDSSNWADEGRFKEIILMNYLKRILPKNVSVGTGFVRSNGEITKQIDIIIYDNTYPLLFSEGDFVVCAGECVLGIIEVKTKIQASKITEIINTANNNGKIIYDCSMPKIGFNGIFSYNIDGNIATYYQYIGNAQPQIINSRCGNMVNHIAIGSEYFLKLWDRSNRQHMIDGHSLYEVYEMKGSNVGLAFSYFFSNLLEVIYKKSIHFIGRMPKEFDRLLFPIEDKTVHKVYEINVKMV